MKNKKRVILATFLLIIVIAMVGCNNKYKATYGYWSGIDNRDLVTYDIHITKDYVIILEDSGAIKYRYKKERTGVRNTLVISNKELSKHIKGMDTSMNSSVMLFLNDDDKENPYVYMLSNMNGRLSDANLYPIEKNDSPLSKAEGSSGSWLLLTLVIGLFAYLYRKKKTK